MRRSLAARVIALFMGFWFVAVSAGPELTHACPMHGGHSATGTAGADAHASHDAPVAAQIATSHHGSPDTDPKSNQCTCLGHCSGTAPVAMAADLIALVETTTAAMRDAGLPDYAYVPVAAQHVLPLAHAPPLSA
ncbi:MAG TPA: hypothetical protein VM076_18680 [Gemmatimonadaceae bacterium]|nr:hypothetical protein [Gemmatimonadaceae bacterium]